MNMTVPVSRGVGGLHALGQNCPSMQQLQGVLDATDPCQAASFATTVTATAPAATNSTAAALAAGTTSNALTGLGLSSNTWLVVGGLVLAAFLLGRK